MDLRRAAAVPEARQGGRRTSRLDTNTSGFSWVGAEEWVRRNHWWLIALGALVFSRYISMLTGVVAAHDIHGQLWSLPHWTQNHGPRIDGGGGWFDAWDSYWYLAAAETGWPQHLNPHIPNTTGFFPALPLLLRFVHALLLGANWPLTGFVTEVLIQIPAVVGVAALARRVLDERQANLAVILFCLFPGTYVFSQIYTEPLFILATVLCLYGLDSRNWWMAGLGAALSGATRPTGLILMALCAWIAAREIWRHGNWKALVAPLISPIGILAFSIYLQIHSGSYRAYMLSQQYAWGQKFTLNAIPREFEFFFSKHKPPSNGLLTASYAWVLLVFLLWAVIGLVLLGILAHKRQMPAIWFYFCLGATVIDVVTDNVGVRARLALLTFPLIFAYARYLRRWYAILPAGGLCVAGLAFLSQSIPGYIP